LPAIRPAYCISGSSDFTTKLADIEPINTKRRYSLTS